MGGRESQGRDGEVVVVYEPLWELVKAKEADRGKIKVLAWYQGLIIEGLWVDTGPWALLNTQGGEVPAFYHWPEIERGRGRESGGRERERAVERERERV